VGMIFCADPQSIEGLKFAGFDVLTLANNHIFNYGRSGFEETKELLQDQDLEGLGEGEFYRTGIEGIKIGFLAMDDVSKKLEVAQVEQIEKVAKEVDVLVVSIHWGAEYRSEPTSRQKELAHKLIEAGAKVIIGHHPHWVEGVEEYKGGVIFYSLGNFVFDQMWSEQTRKGVVARIWLEKEGVAGYELLPIRIYDYSQPRFENSE
jgi:poly-gamma-glutamate synthesis protein (capsule biosynthesis protein)